MTSLPGLDAILKTRNILRQETSYRQESFYRQETMAALQAAPICGLFVISGEVRHGRSAGSFRVLFPLRADSPREFPAEVSGKAPAASSLVVEKPPAAKSDDLRAGAACEMHIH
jgi:hypothetical protein